jgi:hypothetical protein
MLTVGSQGHYEWLVTDEQFDLLQLCPEMRTRKIHRSHLNRQQPDDAH